MCSNAAESERQLLPVLVHVNCQDCWKSSAHLNSVIYPIHFEVLRFEAFSVFFFSFHLMQLHRNPWSSAGTCRVMKELEALRELD